MRKRVYGIIILLCLFVGFQAIAQNATSVADGPWNAGSTWSTGVAPSSANNNITVNHAVHIPSGYSVTIDQTTISGSGSLEIQSGGTVTVAAGPGNDLAVNGLIDVYGTLINDHNAVISGTNGSDLRFYDGSLFRWLDNNANGVPPLATWSVNSTLEIAGFTGGAKTLTSTNWTQNYGNVIWNCPGMSGNHNLAGLITTIQGDFDINDTGTNRALRFTDTETATITIGGDLNVNNTSRLHMTSAGIVDVTIGGNFNFNSTNNGGSTTVLAGIATIHLAGDFVMNAPNGLLRGGTSGTGHTNYHLSGDFIINNGTFDVPGGGPYVNLNFDAGGGTVHTFVNNGLIRRAINYYIATGDILDVGTSPVQGGIFNLSGTVRVGSTDALGAIRSSTNGGNIRTTVADRVYNAGSTIEYNGVGAQFMGNGHPSTANVTTVINNPLGVTLASSPIVINGNLVLTQGNLNVNSTSGSRSLTLGANVIPGANFITFTGPQSDLTITGSGAFGTFPFTAGAQTLRNFTLNRSAGSVVFAQPVTITGAVNLPSGDLIFNGQTLSLSGTFASTGGFLSSDATSTLSITGAGAFGTLVFSNTGNTINTINFTRTNNGSAALSGNLTITNALNLNTGNFTNNGGLILGDGATITRASTSALLLNRPANAPGHFYNVTYSGTNTTPGLELPLPAEEDLYNLTINGGVINLNQNLIINGNVNLNASSINAGTFTITMRGPQWNDNGGTFTPGTGVVVFTGTTVIGGSSEPSFGNFQANSGSALTFPAGNLNISGNMTLNSGGTINTNSGTVVLNGNALQTVAGAGKTLNNLTINKTGGSDAILSSALSLAGILNVQSAGSDFNSAGFLTLLSTSDANTGNASIAALLNGASVSGNVNVQRYMSMEGRIYRYISSPVTNAAVSQIQPEIPVTGTFTGASTCTNCLTNPSLFYYDAATNTYIPYPVSSNAEILTPGRGYAIFVRQDILPGPVTMDVLAPINQGTVNLPIAYAAGDSATWNLVGNPFPSSIDWDSPTGWSKSADISPWVGVRDNGAGGVFNYWDGSVGSLLNGEIGAGQGFWVATTAPGATMSINENAKINTTAPFYREGAPAADALMLHVKKGMLWDKTYIRLRDLAKPGHDGFDVPKLSNDYFNFSSLTTDGNIVAINAMNEIVCDNAIQLKMDFSKRANGTYLINPQGTYSMVVERTGKMNGYAITISDKFTGKSEPLSQSGEFSFTITADPASIASDRFSISFSEAPAATANVIVEAESSVCENFAGKVVLKNVVEGMKYQVLKENALVTEKTAEGSELEFVVEPSFITDSENKFELKSVGFCGTASSISSLTIMKSVIDKPVTYKDTVCNSGAATLKAVVDGAVSYNWYESESSLESIAGQHGETFVTEPLTKSKTYFVSALNSFGCESGRGEVMAQVIITPEITIMHQDGKLISSLKEGNQWYLDGSEIDGAVAHSFIPLVSGLYTLKNNSCGCWAVAEMRVILEEEKFLNGLTVYPNPTSDDIKFYYKDKKEIRNPSLWDVSGKKIGDFSLEKDGLNTKGELNMRYLRPGVYIAKFLIENKLVSVKIVKDK